jgi:HK97 gp10 family phage protein
MRNRSRQPIEIVGTEELIRGLRKFGERGYEAAMGVTRQTTENVKNEAKRRVPKDRPQLVNEIITRYDKDRVRGYVTTTRKGAHGRLIEIGTRHMPAQPFMFPALEQYRPVHPARLRAALQTLIRRTGGRT